MTEPGEHGAIRWEAMRVALMVQRLPALIADDGQPLIVRQAALDSFYVNLRTLIEFLKVPRPKQAHAPDISADNITPGWQPSISDEQAKRLFGDWDGVSKHLVHFSAVRTDQIPKAAADIHRAADDALAVWDQLAEANEGHGFLLRTALLPDVDLEVFLDP